MIVLESSLRQLATAKYACLCFLSAGSFHARAADWSLAKWSMGEFNCMHLEAQHHWTEDDDLVAVYLYKHGTAHLGISVEEIAQKLGMSTASMKMRIQNVKSADAGTGLPHSSKQTGSVLDRFGGLSEAELRAKVKRCLASSTR